MITIGRTGFLLLCTIPAVCPGGTGILRLLAYDNPTQQLSTGQCCDHYLMSNCDRNQCDPQFLICLNQQPASSQCSLVREESYVFNDTNTVTFNSTFGTASNPLRFNFSSWQTGFIITVTVTDFDAGGTSNTMDIMVQSETVNLLAGPVHNGLSLRGSRGRLQLEYSLQCDPGYYGNCALTCSPKNNTYCSASGTLVCLPGFTGSDCSTDIDECLSSPCFNGGTCFDGNNSFTCVCPQGRTGQFCNLVASIPPSSKATTRLVTSPVPVSTTASQSSVTGSTSVVTASSISTPPASTAVASTPSVPTSPYQNISAVQTPSPTQATNKSSVFAQHAQAPVASDEDNTGVVVGGVVGGVVVLLLLLLMVGYFVRKYVIKKKMTVDTDIKGSTDKMARKGEATTASTKPTPPTDLAMI